MKIKLLTLLSFCALSLLLSSNLYSQVGIGTVTPSESLDVVGNIEFSGALMPNNLPGTAGQVLISDGAGNPNNWGADLTNVSYITRYVTATGADIDANTITSMTVTVPGLTTSATAIVNIEGNWSSAIYDDLTIHNIEVRTGEIRFTITNNTGKVEVGDMSAATFVDTTGGASLTGSFATINLDATLLNNDPSTFSLAGDIVTISETGFYSVNYTVTAKQNTGGTRGSLDARVSFDDGSGWASIIGSSSLSFTLLRGGSVQTTGVNYPGMIFNVTVIR